MTCPKCGAEISDNAKFCIECGVAINASRRSETTEKEGKKVTENIFLCPDGKYRWVYEYSMLKNPVILLTVFKVLLIAAGITVVFSMIVNVVNGNPIIVPLTDMERTALPIVGAVLLLCILTGYLVVAASKGFKYCVLFEMDDKGVVHRELPKSMKKTQAISALTFIAGLTAKRPGAAGAGLLAASRNSIGSSFAKVKSVKALRRFHTVKVNEPLAKNQIYAEKEDFDFVLGYILKHVSDKAVKKRR